MDRLPPAREGTTLRILATTDLAGAFVPVPTSYGTAGTCAGVAGLLDAERERQPTIWLDAGDLAVGPVQALLGRRPWPELAELPIAAAAAGNHEFDDGVEALHAAARVLPYPLLCANVDVGLPGSVLVDTGGGPVGVIGLTHPATHRFAPAPPPAPDWPDRVGPLADDLRARGARWVVALLHDGVDWWPSAEPGRPPADGGVGPVGARVDRLARTAAPWSASVDLILGGHTPGAWTGTLGGTPAGHPHIFAASVLVVDLPDPPGTPQVRGVFPAPARRPDRGSPAVDALDAAAANVVGESRHTWLARTGARHYLPDLLAAALRSGTGADAAIMPASQHTTQGAVDGAVAGLRAGPVTELDLMRMFGYPDDRPVVARLRRGEFRAVREALAELSDPLSTRADSVWWNWCRMPSAISAETDEPVTVAVEPNVLPRLGELLGRELDGEPAPVGARQALLAALR